MHADARSVIDAYGGAWALCSMVSEVSIEILTQLLVLVAPTSDPLHASMAKCPEHDILGFGIRGLRITGDDRAFVFRRLEPRRLQELIT